MLEDHEQAGSGLPKLDGFNVEPHRQGQVRLSLHLGQQTYTNILWTDDAEQFVDNIHDTIHSTKGKEKITNLRPWVVHLVVQKRNRPMGNYTLTIKFPMSEIEDDKIECITPMTTLRDLARELTATLRRSREGQPAA